VLSRAGQKDGVGEAVVEAMGEDDSTGDDEGVPEVLLRCATVELALSSIGVLLMAGLSHSLT
jgi:hypothetical protein